MTEQPNTGFREHGLMLYLDTDLYLACVKLQAEKGIGRSYSGLLPLTEGLYHMGFLTKEAYEYHIHRYSEPLQKEVTLTVEQRQEKLENEKQERFFKNVLNQWAEHPNPVWRKKMLDRALLWKDKLKSASMICDLMTETIVTTP